MLGGAITPGQAVGGAVVLLGLALAGRYGTQGADVVVGRPHSQQTIGRR
jgi:hypothetical protein